MLFSVLNYASEDFSDALTPEEMENLLGHHRTFQHTVKSEESSRAAVKLMSTGTAISLSKSGKETVMTDGPFAETKEPRGVGNRSAPLEQTLWLLSSSD